MTPVTSGRLRGAVHQFVDVPVDVHVDGVGATGGQRPTDQGGDHEPDVGEAALGQDHGREGGDEQQLDDARLGRAPRRRRRVRARERRAGKATAGMDIASRLYPLPRPPGRSRGRHGRPWAGCAGRGRYHRRTVSRSASAPVASSSCAGSPRRRSCSTWPPVRRYGCPTRASAVPTGPPAPTAADTGRLPPPGHRVRQPGGGDRPGGGLCGDLCGLVRPAPGPPGSALAVRRADPRDPGRVGAGGRRRLLKLNAYVVMTHFMVGIALLTVSVVLCLRADHAPGRGTSSSRAGCSG